MRLCQALPALLIIAASRPHPAIAQNLEKAADLRIPTYNSDVLEITPQRLDRLEMVLKSAPDLVTARKEREKAYDAKRAWDDCQRKVQGSHQPAGQRAKKEVGGNQAELQKLGAETEQKIKNAKSQEEVQQIIAEMTAKQQALTAPAQKVNEDYGQDLTTKCGEKPSTEAAVRRLQDAEQQRNAKVDQMPPALNLMNERVTVYCFTPMNYVGPDGAVSTSDGPFRRGDKGSMHYNIEVYSPKEAALLNERCGRIKPLLISRELVSQ